MLTKLIIKINTIWDFKILPHFSRNNADSLNTVMLGWNPVDSVDSCKEVYIPSVVSQVVTPRTVECGNIFTV